MPLSFQQTFHLPTTDDPHGRKGIGQTTANRRAEVYTLRHQTTMHKTCIACCSCMLSSQMSLLSFQPLFASCWQLEKRKADWGSNPRLARYRRATQPVYGGIVNSNTINPRVESGPLRVIRPRILEPTVLRANLTIPIPVQSEQRSIAVIHTHINAYIARSACEGS